MKKNLSILLLLATFHANAQKLNTESFNYDSGQLSDQGKWSQSQGTEYFQVVAPGLTYPGYPLNGDDNAVALKVASISQSTMDIGTTINSGDLFCGFLLNVKDAPLQPDFIFGFTPSEITSTYLGGRLLIQKNANDILSFDIKANLNGPKDSKTPFTYALNTTYLMVLKYSFIPGPGNDALKLFIINSTIPQSEPADAAINSVTDPENGDMDNINSLSIIAHSSALSAIFDGIVIATSWADLFSPITATTSSSTTLSMHSYPNPATETIHFTQPLNIEFQNMNGQVLTKQDAISTLDVRPYPAGIYVLKCTLGEYTMQRMIVVQK